MAIYSNDKKISNLSLGDKPIKKVFSGNDLVWSSKPPFLKSGTLLWGTEIWGSNEGSIGGELPLNGVIKNLENIENGIVIHFTDEAMDDNLEVARGRIATWKFVEVEDMNNPIITLKKDNLLSGRITLKIGPVQGVVSRNESGYIEFLNEKLALEYQAVGTWLGGGIWSCIDRITVL